MIELILGGARSGKSSYAERQAKASGLAVTYIATGEARDAEMAERIAHHRERRPAAWRTVEAPLRLADALRRETAANTCTIVDCLTLWLSNVLLGAQEHEIEKLLARHACNSTPWHTFTIQAEPVCQKQLARPP